MAVTIEPDKAMLRAEISRHFRKRLHGFYLAGAAAALCIVGLAYSFDMMHEPGAIPVTATIIAVERDPASGETWMTSEFVDHQGVMRQDRLASSYHYARGEPEVGERIGYVYEISEYTGDLDASPRADGPLQWIFGIPALLFVAMATGVAWFAWRQRALRRRLLASGRREPGTAHAIERKTVTLPGGKAGPQQIHKWRLRARYFESTLPGFRDCHSDWQPMPSPELAPQIHEDSPVSPILLDPANPKRYWLPLGPLLKPVS